MEHKQIEKCKSKCALKLQLTRDQKNLLRD